MLELDALLWVVELGAELVEVAVELLEAPAAPEGAALLEPVLVPDAARWWRPSSPSSAASSPELELDGDFRDAGAFVDSGIGSGPVAVVVGHSPVSPGSGSG